MTCDSDTALRMGDSLGTVPALADGDQGRPVLELVDRLLPEPGGNRALGHAEVR